MLRSMLLVGVALVALVEDGAAQTLPARPNEPGAASGPPGATVPEWQRKAGVYTTRPVELVRDADGNLEARANLGDLLSRSEGRGLEDIRLVGRVETKVEKGQTVARVTWHKVVLEKPAAQPAAAAPPGSASGAVPSPQEKAAGLVSPLKSAFAAQARRVEPGVKLTARGDVPAMLAAARSLLDAEGGRAPGGPAAGSGEAGRQASAQGAGGARGGAGAGGRGSGAGAGGLSSGAGAGSRSLSAGAGGLAAGAGTGGLASGAGTGGLTNGAGTGGQAGGVGAGGLGSDPSAGSPGTVTAPGGGAAAPAGSAGTPGSTTDGGTGPGGTAPGGTPDPATPAVSITITQTGCTPRDSKSEGVVIIQARAEKTEGGVVTDPGTCQDTLERYQIRYDFGACTYLVDRAAGFATPRARRYWARDVGSPEFLGSCEPVAEQRAALVTTDAGCTPVLDPIAGRVAVYERRVYTDREGRTVEADGCQPLGKTAPVAWTVDGCSIRHDVGGARSYERQRAVMAAGGQTLEVSACQDRGASWAHVRTAEGCTASVDRAASRAVRRERTIVNGSRGVEVVQDCAAVETVGLSWAAAGCAGYAHDLAAGESYAMERLYYLDAGAPVYVSQCEPNKAKKYAHLTEVFDWVHDDAGQRARARFRTFIAAPSGAVDVAAPAHRADVAAVSYVSQSTRAIENRQRTAYTGCTATPWVETFTTYARPDGSTVELLTNQGAGAVRNACTSRRGEGTYYDYYTGRTWSTAGSSQDGYAEAGYSCARYQMRAVWEREDGQVVYGTWHKPPTMAEWYALNGYGSAVNCTPGSFVVSGPSGGGLGATAVGDEGSPVSVYGGGGSWNIHSRLTSPQALAALGTMGVIP